MNILDKIVANTRIEVDKRKEMVSIDTLKRSPYMSRNCISMVGSIRNPNKTGVIAEHKIKSPSKGIINDRLSVEEITTGYNKYGASGLSVLTDHAFFGGDMEHLQRARRVNDIPILRKDFMIDPYQVWEAKSIGADCILLIAACLTKNQIDDLGKLAHDLGMEVLLEVHDLEELESSISECIDMIGVNNRSLKTFEVSVQTSLDLAKHIPDRYLKVSESGLSDFNTIQTLKKAGYEGFLIGETFMKTENPGLALNALFVDR